MLRAHTEWKKPRKKVRAHVEMTSSYSRKMISSQATNTPCLLSEGMDIYKWWDTVPQSAYLTGGTATVGIDETLEVPAHLSSSS
jgi:hypothetical protein